MARDMQTSFCEIKIKTREHSVALVVITVNSWRTQQVKIENSEVQKHQDSTIPYT